MWEALMAIWNNFISRATYDNMKDISLAADFTFPEQKNGFFLYVGVAGVIKGETFSGGTFSHNFVTGYHCVKMRKILSTANGTTATDLAACF